MSAYNLVSLLGIFVIAAFAWLLSANRKVVNWRVVGWGIGLQFLFALFIFVVPVGTKFFLFVNRVVIKLLDSATAGTRFVFGRLALPPGAINEAGETSLGSILAFQGLSTIIFFAALIGALYHLGVMPFFVRLFARVFTRLMRVSGAESLCVSSEIFVGVESSLIIRPHLAGMTRSELTTIMTAGMSTIASTVLAVYVFLLQSEIPAIAGHLVSASFLAAPATLVISKLLMPETGRPETLGVDIKPHYEREENLILAVINGAKSGLQLLGGIITLLLAFLGLLALLDLVLGWFGGYLNQWFGWHLDWSFKAFLGYIFYPFTLVIGVPPGDALAIAKVVGERTVATEVASFQDLSQLLAQGALQSPRSALIGSYAVCGFAHVASLAIFIGGIGALVPSRYKDLSRLGFRALLAATLVGLMTAAVAGTFFTGGSILLGK
ncbi:MAG: nucleoside transporter C-terminal domain-containing protein [Candidatus Aminicenantales bacterium]